MTPLLVGLLLTAAGLLSVLLASSHHKTERVLLLLSALSFYLMALMLGRSLLSDARPSKTIRPAETGIAVEVLIQAPLSQWLAASPGVQSASAYALLVRLRQEQIFRAPIRSVREYTPWVQALEACLQADRAEASQTVETLAYQCVHNDGLKRWR